jgi:MFS family permease
VFGVQGVIMVLLQAGLLGLMVRLWGEWRLLRGAVVVFLTGLLLALFADSMPWMLAAAYLAMSGSTLCMPLLNSITSQRTPMAWRGRMLGTTSSAASWGRVAGPLLAGSNLAVFGYTGAWLGCVAIVLCYLGWAFSAQLAPVSAGAE